MISQDDLRQQLIAATARYDIAVNPFVEGIGEGIYPQSSLHHFGKVVVEMASAFPYTLAAILSCCDNLDVRQSLLANLLEEEGGVSFKAGSGLVVDRTRRHSELAARFAQAVGVDIQDDCRLVEQPQWITQKLRERCWIGPLAYFAVGYELNVPFTFRALLGGLRTHYGFTDDELLFFTEHLDADERHGAEGIAMITAAAKTPSMQRDAIEGARRGALVWWQLLRRLDKIVSQQ
ncbi:MAG TPA: iron-containing redox enzyme family protein [Blastocatellia bacterium]|nr:iron-containing redox enzyme family protein [Blastocatellia bacterium]